MTRFTPLNCLGPKQNHTLNTHKNTFKQATMNPLLGINPNQYIPLNNTNQ